jgi:cytochrome b involved in lipid metabolism
MKNTGKIIFFAVLILAAGAGGALYYKNAGSADTPEKPAYEATKPAENTNANTVAVGEPNNSCIITIDGKKYDVTSFRGTHPGGNIFKCGEDMSAAFAKQHKNNFKMIEKLLIK